MIKTNLEPATLATAVREQVLAGDPQQPIYNLRTLAEVRENTLVPIV